MNRYCVQLTPIAALLLTACSIVPPLEPIEHKPAASRVAQPRMVQMTLSDAISKYAPAGYTFDPNADVDFSTPITLDTSLPWSVAFEDALARAGIDQQALTAKPDPQPSVATQAAPEPKLAARGEPRAKQAAVATVQPVVAAIGPASSPLQAAVSAAPAAAPTPTFSSHQCQPSSDLSSPDAKEWQARANDGLEATLERWRLKSGWDLTWNYRDEQTGERSDLTLGGGLHCAGSFKDAVRALIDALPSDVRIRARLVSANSPPLLRIDNDNGGTQ